MTDEERRAKAREKARRWRAANPSRALENVRRWQAANPDKIREARRKRTIRERAANPPKGRVLVTDEEKRAKARLRWRRWAERYPEKIRARNSDPEKLQRSKEWQRNSRPRMYALKKQWRDANKDKEAAAKAAYYIDHAEERREYSRRYRTDNPLKVQEYNNNQGRANHRRWLKNPDNHEKVLKYGRQYRRDNPDKNRAHAWSRRSRTKDATPPWADRKCLKEFKCLCPAGCHVDHIFPLKGITPDGHKVCGLNVIWNLRYATAFENGSKHNRVQQSDINDYEEFLATLS